MSEFETTNDYYRELKMNYPKMSDYELLLIAVQQQRNDILISGLKVDANSNHPSALEQIAIQLGANDSKYDPESIAHGISRIADSVEEIQNNINIEK